MRIAEGAAMNGPCQMLLVLAMFTAACGSSVEGVEGVDGVDGVDAAPPDLFACGVEVDCVIDYGHLGETVTAEALRCSGELVVSGEPGVIKTMSSPGPYAMEVETLYVVHGDGTATFQTRILCENDGGCGGLAASEEWQPEALELCAVSFDPAKIEGCDEPEGVCEWHPKVIDCAPADDAWTCADLAL
jgi:hypothetical protein